MSPAPVTHRGTGPAFRPDNERRVKIMETDETRPITDEVFIAAMRAVVEERGRDYLYPVEWKDDDSCRYVTPGGDGYACIIGAALGRTGVPPATLARHEGVCASKVLADLPMVHVSVAVMDAADHAQGAQDDGDPWGYALDNFLCWLPS